MSGCKPVRRAQVPSFPLAVTYVTEYSAVSTPFNVEHKIHVDFNSTTGFVGLPPAWEAMLKSSGISPVEVREVCSLPRFHLIWQQNPDLVLDVLKFQAKRVEEAEEAPSVCCFDR